MALMRTNNNTAAAGRTWVSGGVVETWIGKTRVLTYVPGHWAPRS